MIRTAFSLFFIFLSNLFFAQQQILFASEYNNKMHKDFVQQNKLTNIILFYQNEFVVNDSTKFNEDMLCKTIINKIPNPKATGFAVLDWEGKATEILLTKPSNSKEFIDMANEYVRSIEYARKLRPNIKWGFYNFPAVNYGSISSRQKNEIYQRYLSIMKASDFLTPSLYLLNDRTEVSDSFSYLYAAENTKMTIEFGKKLNKKVFPFVWQRYTGNSKSNNGLVEPLHFQKFIKTILSQTVDNRKVDGIIWWDCENYLYNERVNFKNLKNEYAKVSSKNVYQKGLLNKYLDLIKKSQ